MGLNSLSEITTVAFEYDFLSLFSEKSVLKDVPISSTNRWHLKVDVELK